MNDERLRMKEFLEFLRFAMDKHTTQPEHLEEMDWQGLHDFGQKQAILGVLFCGIERLTGDNKPSRELLMQWYMESEQIRKRNIVMNRQSARLTKKFQAEGFRNCIIKGQGNATMYPQPYSRNPGDIDIWLEGDRKKILRYVRQYVPNANHQYHHVDFPVVKGVAVEIH